MTPVLLVLAAPILVLAVHDLLRRPTLRRLAVRNAARRPGEAVLVLIGSLLGTAIITASFIVGDSLRASIRDVVRTQLGPVDVTLRVSGLDHLDDVERAVRSRPVPGADGVLRLVTVPVAAATPGTDPRAEPRAALVEVDVGAARRFGDDPATTGFGGDVPAPGPGEAVVSRDLADALEVAAGDPVVVHAYGRREPFVVRAVVPRLGVAGFAEDADGKSPNVFVAPGTIARLAAADTTRGAAPPDGFVLVSNRGGVLDGAAGSVAVERLLEDRVSAIPGVEVRAIKQEVLDDADSGAESFTGLFGGIGSFSVIAGILLLVNVFVMLADERKSELGMLRAVGLKRNHVVRAFGLEGVFYSLVASALGALAGLGVGRVVIVAASAVFANDDEFDLSLRFAARLSSVVGGFLIGAAISVLTVWFASVRIGRLNVIRAIRDLPDPPRTRARPLTLVGSALGVIAGGALFATALSGEGQWLGGLAGPPLAAYSAIPLLRRLVASSVVVTVASAASLAWAVVAFNVIPDAFDGVDIPAFVLQGVILVASAVVLLGTNAGLTGRAVDRLSGSRTLAARLGLAYPLARRFRTSMLLGMYALVIFTLTLLAVFTELFTSQAPRFTRELRAGHELVVDASRGNPVPSEVLDEQPEVVAASPLLRAFPEFSHAGHPERDTWALSALDERLLRRGHPTLGERDPRYPDDRSAWEAILAEPSLVAVSDFFLQDGGGPPESDVEPGDVVTVHNRRTGESRDLTVVGVVESDWVFNGAMVSSTFAREFLGAEAVPSRHYVALRDGLDPDDVAADLNGRLIEFGVDADSMATVVERGLAEQEGFFTLLQGYLALGLVIGIAGLGVVMVRAVRERRRQIGMLRAMGFPSRLVRQAFLLEAAYVAAQGVVVGTALGLIVAYSLTTNSDAFGEERLDFVIPWLSLVVVLVATLGASLLAVLAPATQAARIRPAVALRIAD